MSVSLIAGSFHLLLTPEIGLAKDYSVVIVILWDE